MSEFWVGFLFGAAVVCVLCGLALVWVNSNVGPFR